MFLLYTNIVSYWMRGDKRVIERIKEHVPANLSLSTITLAEILYGIEKSPVKKKERRLRLKQITSLLTLYPFDDTAAGEYAIVRAQLESEGMVISERDTQIASIALSNNPTVLTHNVKEFGRIGNLRVEDWANQ